MKMAAAVQPFDIYHLCIMLGVLTGITYPEMCGLQWQDVDTENGLIHIRRLGLAGVTPEGYIADCKIVPLGTLDVYGNIQAMLKAEKKRRRYGK